MLWIIDERFSSVLCFLFLFATGENAIKSRTNKWIKFWIVFSTGWTFSISCLSMTDLYCRYDWYILRNWSLMKELYEDIFKKSLKSINILLGIRLDMSCLNCNIIKNIKFWWSFQMISINSLKLLKLVSDQYLIVPLKSL